MISMALAALAMPTLAQEVTSYNVTGPLCNDVAAVDDMQALVTKYKGEANSILVAAAEHNLPCMLGTMVTSIQDGRPIMSFVDSEGKNYDILAFPWGEATVFSYVPAKESPTKKSSYKQ